MKLHNAQDRVHELNRAAAEIARSVADAAGRKGDRGRIGRPDRASCCSRSAP